MRSKATGTREPNGALEFRAFHVARGGTCRGMTQTIANRRQPLDGAVQLLGLGSQARALDSNPAVGQETLRNFFQRESCGTAESDEREAFQDPRVEEAPHAAPSCRSDEPFLFIEPQRRGGHARALSHHCDIEKLHA